MTFGKIEKDICSNCKEEKYITYKRGKLCKECNEHRKNGFKLSKELFKEKNRIVLEDIESRLETILDTKNSKKLPSIKTLRNKLDKLFSQFIRMRDTDENGYGNCCTCNDNIHYKEAHCGHFMKRGRWSTRWKETNCALQCPGCNTYRDGEQFKFSLYINNRWGEDIALEMLEQSKIEWKPSQSELYGWVKYYENKVEELKQTKNFEI